MTKMDQAFATAAALRSDDLAALLACLDQSLAAGQTLQEFQQRFSALTVTMSSLPKKSVGRSRQRRLSALFAAQ